ncbi:hypothetical protein SAMN05421665_0245 [Yoonia rosea]|uniref:Uncharacterized protein n=1 Tax=Yoonia rosea TaxID=287098 RepID=A0A1R3WC61_9RHOB|nr:hypothetical protein SAMN05421665_0245 [Yoonia rosea]
MDDGRVCPATPVCVVVPGGEVDVSLEVGSFDVCLCGEEHAAAREEGCFLREFCGERLECFACVAQVVVALASALALRARAKFCVMSRMTAALSSDVL